MAKERLVFKDSVWGYVDVRALVDIRDWGGNEMTYISITMLGTAVGICIFILMREASK